MDALNSFENQYKFRKQEFWYSLPYILISIYTEREAELVQETYRMNSNNIEGFKPSDIITQIHYCLEEADCNMVSIRQLNMQGSINQNLSYCCFVNLTETKRIEQSIFVWQSREIFNLTYCCEKWIIKYTVLFPIQLFPLISSNVEVFDSRAL